MKPKVLMIDVGGWGGITHYTYNLMDALARNAGVDCALLTDREYELEPLARNFRVIKKPLNNQPYLAAVRRVMDTVAQERPDIVHVQTMISARKDWLLFALGCLSKMKIIFTAHNILPHEDREKQAFFMKTAFRIIYACSHRVIVHSLFSKERLRRLFGVAESKVAVIPHGNYLFFRREELSKSQARELLALPQDKKIILQFGALREYKGIDILIEAFKDLAQRRSDILLFLVGKPLGLGAEQLAEVIRRHGLEQAVDFRPKYIPLEEIGRYFFAADAVVFPYKEIDTSGSLQVAYAFGKPVIAAQSGSMPEVVDDNKNGILVRPEDAYALAAACERVVGDQDLMARMGEHSLFLARHRFGWDGIAAQTARVYNEVAR